MFHLKRDAPRLISRDRHHSIAVTLLGLAGPRKKHGPKDGLIDGQSARLYLLGVLNHPKNNVRATHRSLDEWVAKEISSRSLQRYWNMVKEACGDPSKKD